ncbi:MULTISPECIES: IS110 family RNA-guided transposase [Cupriavidus]|uniref:Transposase n=1 Tax=Cupriavidus necator (strain ATCC 43291 / DSM 13513 / CCUG 52238 / LMG 8453 / N-1) TaxID=1042878 RepID=F8GX12_CUPNN|nr:MULTISPECIES: IS110 family transposase [Cupriavidus]AEI81744.1 transposase [Cupriavidus necator N-1]AEI81882.1 transposase [Cupriavidus necator N-1]AEI82035.1 transposase [Cupriavidus necator N-1]KAI3603256.1 Mobile element protein [Cupriavidus necator H850]MDW3681494.1 IS110 family transposase [Cupriavidus sp. CV2]
MNADHATELHAEDAILAVSLELSAAQWKVALHDGFREQPAVHSVGALQAASRLQAVLDLIEQQKRKWSLPSHVRVVVSYEAGQDGFWILRSLRSRGIDCYMVDAASIPVERHKRRAKTDRLDAIKLVTNLRAWLHGERDRMRVVRAPSLQDEASRHLIRDRGQLQKEVMQHRDRMRKLLVTVGCWDEVDHRAFAKRLARGELTCHDGSPLPDELRERLLRESHRLELAEQQLKDLQRTLHDRLPEPVRERITWLKRLRGVGDIGASRLMLELFWRQFRNRRQLGACVGLVPQPYDSGQSRVDQGISKQGNRRVRVQLIEMAWGWLRYQPGSALTRWFNERTQGTGPNRRARRIAIVALARRLVIALWRYLTEGIIPDGAQFKLA